MTAKRHETPKTGTIEGHYSPPQFEYELGEIERVATTFKPDNVKNFVREFVMRGRQTELTDLTEDIWAKLENTDSYDIQLGDWKMVADMASQNQREWESKKTALESGEALPVAIIMKMGDVYHKVAGNTRLMIERALGLVPKVVIVDMTDFE